MLTNGKLARCIADVGFYEFRRQLMYKAEQRGCEVIIADRFYASSKTCGYCGEKNEELKLSDRRWKCPHCGAEIKDRDFNAAINLRRYTERPDWFRWARRCRELHGERLCLPRKGENSERDPRQAWKILARECFGERWALASEKFEVKLIPMMEEEKPRIE